MDKEQLKSISTDALIISKIKEAIFQLVRTKYNFDESDVIAAINNIPISKFRTFLRENNSKEQVDAETIALANEVIHKLRIKNRSF